MHDVVGSRKAVFVNFLSTIFSFKKLIEDEEEKKRSFERYLRLPYENKHNTIFTSLFLGSIIRSLGCSCSCESHE